MTTPKTDIKSQAAELSTDAFEAFCNDIAGMFGLSMESSPQPACNQTVKDLEKNFKKLSAVITVNAKGTLEGDFYVVFDKEALFTLAGTIVMLPEERIRSFRRKGSLREAEELYDAVGEIGNLLVGSWSRIFREGLEGHVHFLETGTFIGNPWSDSRKTISLSGDEAFLFLPYEVTIGTFSGVTCGIIFPEAVFGHTAATPSPEPADTVAPASVEELQTEEADASAEAPAPVSAEAPVPEPDPEPVEDSGDEEANTPADNPETAQAAGGAVSQAIQEMVQSLPVLSAEHTQTLLGVCAKDFMQKEVLWGHPDDSVQQALEKMQQADVACMMVGDSNSLEGIVTWIDVAEAVSIYLRPVFAKWRRPEDDATLQIKTRVIMTRPVHTIKPQTPLTAIMKDMCRHRLRCMPVVNAQGQVEGVVTAFDIFKLLLKTPGDLSVADRMPQSTVSPTQ